jgi:hypothetical protein
MAYAMNANVATQSVPARAATKAAPVRMPFFKRLINAMVESRMRSAQLELRRHARFLEELESGKISAPRFETFERSA